MPSSGRGAPAGCAECCDDDPVIRGVICEGHAPGSPFPIMRRATVTTLGGSFSIRFNGRCWFMDAATDPITPGPGDVLVETPDIAGTTCDECEASPLPKPDADCCPRPHAIPMPGCVKPESGIVPISFMCDLFAILNDGDSVSHKGGGSVNAPYVDCYSASMELFVPGITATWVSSRRTGSVITTGDTGVWKVDLVFEEFINSVSFDIRPNIPGGAFVGATTSDVDSGIPASPSSSVSRHYDFSVIGSSEINIQDCTLTWVVSFASPNPKSPGAVLFSGSATVVVGPFAMCPQSSLAAPPSIDPRIARTLAQQSASGGCLGCGDGFEGGLL